MKNIRIIQSLAWAIVAGAVLTLFLTLLPERQNQKGGVSIGTGTAARKTANITIEAP